VDIEATTRRRPVIGDAFKTAMYRHPSCGSMTQQQRLGVTSQSLEKLEMRRVKLSSDEIVGWRYMAHTDAICPSE